jgi:type VI secretion system secreted protein VgrG
MKPQHIAYLVTLAGQELAFRAVRGREALSEPSVLRGTAILRVGDSLEPDDLAGSECEVRIVADGSTFRSIRLVIMSAERGASVDQLRVGVPLDLEMRSPIALAQHRVDIRIFRDLDVPSIVEKVLKTFGIAVTRRLQSSYAVRPYTVQWRESDLAFVSRLLEDEGIYYKATDQGGIILGDSPSAYDEASPIAFVPPAGLEAADEAVTRIGWRGSMTPGKVTMRDFDFKKPKLDVTSTTSVGAKAGGSGGEFYQYPAGRVEPGAAAAKANLTVEAFGAAQHRVRGESSRLGMSTNQDIPMHAFPAGFTDGRYATVVVEHEWDETRPTFALRFEAISASTTFRPMPLTPRPSLVGATVGNVTGAAGEDIHTDEWGRAKVHFHWDRLQPKDDNCSDWIPTLQDNTGHSIGIPRVGWEVMVQNLEGDPDKPIILGRTYTPEDDFYSLLPNNRMFTTLRSLTSPRSKTGYTGENFVQILDLKDNEHIRFQAQKDQVVLTEHDKTEDTGARDSRLVDGHERIKVGKSRHHDITNNHVAVVDTWQEVTIGNDRKLTVKKKFSEAVTGDRSLSIGSTHMRRLGTMDEVHANDNLTETIGALSLEMCPQGNQTSTQIAEAVVVGGAMIEIAKQGVSQNAQKAHVEVIGAMLHQEAKLHIGLRASTTRTTTAGGNYTGKSGTAVLVSGLKSLKMTVGQLVMSAKKTLTLRVQNTTIILQAEKHSFDVPETITAHADGRNDLNAAKSGQNDRSGG